MYLNNKGFAISTVLYSLLIMATLILFLLVGNLSFERRTTSNFVNDIKDELNAFASIFGNSKSEGKLLAEALLTSVGDKGSYYDDGTDTFITGEDPNNYIWYSGKLWRAVSVNNEEKTTKLVTQWNISIIGYTDDGTDFAESYAKAWLNDQTVDGFLYNLRDVDNFLVTNSKWNSTMDYSSLGNVKRPSDSGTIVNATVGLLNLYEYQESFRGTTYSNGYLNNGLHWWTITPYSNINMNEIDNLGNSNYFDKVYALGIRPSINLKSNVKIVDGNGTLDNLYRLSVQ